MIFQLNTTRKSNHKQEAEMLRNICEILRIGLGIWNNQNVWKTSPVTQEVLCWTSWQYWQKIKCIGLWRRFRVMVWVVVDDLERNGMTWRLHKIEHEGMEDYWQLETWQCIVQSSSLSRALPDWCPTNVPFQIHDCVHIEMNYTNFFFKCSSQCILNGTFVMYELGD